MMLSMKPPFLTITTTRRLIKDFEKNHIDLIPNGNEISSSSPSSIDVCSQTMVSYVSVYHLDCARYLGKSYHLFNEIEHNRITFFL